MSWPNLLKASKISGSPVVQFPRLVVHHLLGVSGGIMILEIMYDWSSLI